MDIDGNREEEVKEYKENNKFIKINKLLWNVIKLHHLDLETF